MSMNFHNSQGFSKTYHHGLRDEFLREDHHNIDAPEYLLGRELRYYPENDQTESFVSYRLEYRCVLGKTGIW